jgi:hypothetical protein
MQRPRDADTDLIRAAAVNRAARLHLFGVAMDVVM